MTTPIALKPTELALEARRKKKDGTRFTLALRASLKTLKFNPVKNLINSVYPQLDPKDQMRVNLEMIKLLYPSYDKAFEMSRTRKSDKQQRNLQVNIQNNVTSPEASVVTNNTTNPPPTSTPKITLEDLRRLAATNNDYPDNNNDTE